MTTTTMSMMAVVAWQRGRRDPAIVIVFVVVVVDDDGNDGNKRILEAEQRGRRTKDVLSPTPSSAAGSVLQEPRSNQGPKVLLLNFLLTYYLRTTNLMFLVEVKGN